MKLAQINVFEINPWIYFMVLCLGAFLITFFGHRILLTESVYWNSFGEQLTLNRIHLILIEQKRWVWLIYVLTPPLYLLKFLLVGLCLSIGMALFHIQIPFIQLFKIALISESVFLLPALLTLLWFGLTKSDFGLAEVQRFSPWSLSGYLGDRILDHPLQSLFESINLFEILYCAVLAAGVRLRTKLSYSGALRMVIGSYGSGFLIYTLFMIFLQLSVL